MPAQSLDLNSIEAPWAIVQQKLLQYCPKNFNKLKEIIVHGWQQIPLELCQKLALSYYKRSLACFRAKGNDTKY